MEGLTERELQILELLLQGYENRQIAPRIGCATRTVKAHFNRIFQKFDLTEKGLRRVRLAVMVYRFQRHLGSLTLKDALSNLSIRDLKTGKLDWLLEPPSTLSRITSAISMTN